MTNIEKAEIVVETNEAISKVKEAALDSGSDAIFLYEHAQACSLRGCEHALSDRDLTGYWAIDMRVNYINMLIEGKILPNLEKLA